MPFPNGPLKYDMCGVVDDENEPFSRRQSEVVKYCGPFSKIVSSCGYPQILARPQIHKTSIIWHLVAILQQIRLTSRTMG